MIHKMVGMVTFLVLCCILAETRAYYPTEKGAVGPLIWAPEHKPDRKGAIFRSTTRATADKTYLCLGGCPEQPIDITSKRVNFRNMPDGKEVMFTGNVKLKQGDVTLTCDRLFIEYDEKSGANITEQETKKLAKGLENLSQIKSITASGNVKIVQNERMAVGNEAIYDFAKRTFILKGVPALLRDGPELLNGSQIIINREEDRKGSIIEPVPDGK